MQRRTPDRLLAALHLCGAVLVGTGAASAGGELRLSELVSSNDGSLRDENGDAPDWIELRNTGTETVALAGWGLSDRAGQPFKWTFPARTLPAGASLVVFASGKNRTPAGGRLHTNFAIDGDGEAVVLTSPDGTATDAAPAAWIPEGLSLGRSEPGGAWRFFAAPTPGLANAGASYGAVLREAPEVSIPGGFHPDPVTLLAAGEPGAVVRYTLDGSEPDEGSPEFPPALAVGSRAGQPNELSMIQGTSTANQHTDGWRPPVGEVRKATVVRVRAFKPDARPSPSATHTYFIGAAARHADGLPVLSLATERSGLFDHERGIYMLGKVFADYVAAHPGEALTGHTPANYTQRGAAWNRAASLEFFDPGGTRAFAVPVRLDIKGQSSRSFRQKSFGLDIRDAEGGRGRIGHRLFPGLTRLGDGAPMDVFRTLRLRNFGNDWAYASMRDAFCHRMAEGLGLVRMAWQPVSVYLDGEYWGVLEMREELDGSYFETHYGVPRDEVAIVNAPGSVVEGVAGDEASFIALRTYAETHDLSVPAHYEHVAARMDVDAFLRYQFVEIWCGNADWPHNNTRAWRRRLATPLADPASVPPGHDGRWRWMLFDLDLAVAHPWAGGAGENTLSYALSPTGRPPINAPWATSLLRALMGNPEVKRRFASLAADLLNTHFRDTRATGMVDAMRAVLQPAMPEHIRRWQSNGNSATTWSGTHVQAVRNFASQRTINVRQHFTTQLALGGYATLTADVQPAGSGTLVVNHRLRLDPSLPGTATPVYPWRGTYFRNVPVVLQAEPAPGHRFAGWSTPAGLNPQSELTLTLSAATTVTARFVPAPADAPFDFRVAESLADGRPRLLFHGVPGAAFTLERSDDMRSWVPETAFFTDPDGRWEFSPPAGSETAPKPPGRYYRVTAP